MKNIIETQLCLAPRFQPLCAVVDAATALFAPSAVALPSFGSDCSTCHSATQNGMYLTNYQAVANLGAGLFKVFRVSRGQTVPIQLQVTNAGGGNYGLTIKQSRHERSNQQRRPPCV